MISRFERFSYALFGIYRSWHKIASDVMAKYDMKGSTVTYLMAMRRRPEGITASQLGEICGRDKADVSRAIAAMEKKGLVRKEGENSNLYRAMLILTEEGIEAADHVQERADLAVELAGEGLTDEQRTMLYDTLERIDTTLQTISENGLPEK